MKRLLLLLVCILESMIVSAQTQQGIVKTRGRMVNGKHVPGNGLPGATVTIQGGNSYNVQKANGAFSFPVPAETFLIQRVRKKGYELIDVDATIKPRHYSLDTLYLVMETPEQLLKDLLDAKQKISRTLRAALQKNQAEIKRLKEQNLITQQEYDIRNQQLTKDLQANSKLIEEMAKQYVQIDYDQMNNLNRRISDAILNGRLTEADSLLRLKGDMKSRNNEIDQRLQIETLRKEEIAEEQKILAQSEAGTRKMLEDFANDYTNWQLTKDTLDAYGSEVAVVLEKLSSIALFKKDFAQAEKLAQEALMVDSTRIRINVSLAAALLFQGKYSEAETIYEEYKEDLKIEFLNSFQQFEIEGIIPKECEEEMEKIMTIIN